MGRHQGGEHERALGRAACPVEGEQDGRDRHTLLGQPGEQRGDQIEPHSGGHATSIGGLVSLFRR
ncbi:hypothetical protein [Microbispora sp. CA-102843]|uniref:hypothetical protein n=1 Tax=Microbispora sp. CA-102843 TaxID=3239952 RepID=UPI003D8BDC72